MNQVKNDAMNTNRTTAARTPGRFKAGYISVAVTILAGLLLSLVTFTKVRSWENHKTQLEFKRVAADRISALGRGLLSNLLVIESLGAFYSASREVERREFEEFVKPLLARHPSVQALEWIPRVPLSQRTAYEKAALLDGFPQFQITERQAQGKMVRAASREEYFPVYFVEPYQGNELAFGFDLASSATRREALNKSRDTGQMVASARITLVQETGDQFGLLVFLPLYEKGAVIESIANRRKHLKGFVLGVFRVSDIVERALTYMAPEVVDILVHDASASENERFLYHHRSQARQMRPAPAGTTETQQRAQLRHTHTFKVAEREFSVVCTPTPGFIYARKTWQAWGVLLFGLVCTGFLATYFLINIRRGAQLAESYRNLQVEIRERRHTEEALRESEAKYRDLYENAPTAYCTVSASDGSILQNNLAFEQLLGYSEKDIRDMKVFDLYADTHEGIPRAQEIFRDFRSGQAAHAKEVQMKRKNGELIWVNVSVDPIFDAHGTVVESRSVITDVNERKQAEEALRESEERFREMAEHIREVFWLFDWIERRVIYVSPAYEAIWGRSIEDLYHRYEEWAESVYPDDLTHAQNSFAQIARTGGGETREYRIIRPDGTVRWISDRGFAILDEESQVGRIAGIAEDITERKQAEQEKILREKLESMIEMAGAVCHELNQPMMAISGYSELALMNVSVDDPLYDKIAKIRAQIQRMGRVTAKLMQITKYETRDYIRGRKIIDIEKSTKDNF